MPMTLSAEPISSCRAVFQDLTHSYFDHHSISNKNCRMVKDYNVGSTGLQILMLYQTSQCHYLTDNGRKVDSYIKQELQDGVVAIECKQLRTRSQQLDCRICPHLIKK